MIWPDCGIVTLLLIILRNQTGILTLIIDNPKSSDKGRRESKPTFSRIAKVFFGAGFKDFWHFHADTFLGFHADSQH